MLNSRDIIEKILNTTNNNETTLVAIDGLGGSGKSTLSKEIKAAKVSCDIVEMDDFYLPESERTQSGCLFDLERLEKEVLYPLKANGKASYYKYDWDKDRVAVTATSVSSRIVIVEGVYSYSRTLRSYYKHSIWVECDFDTRLMRGVQRDGEEMRKTWVEIWMPAEQEYKDSQQTDRHVDFIFLGNLGN